MTEITEEEKKKLDYEEMTKKAYATTMISIEGFVKTNTDLIAEFIRQTKEDMDIFRKEIVQMRIKDSENSLAISEEIKTVNLAMINFSSKMETMQEQMKEFKANCCTTDDKPIREKMFQNFRNKMKIFGGLQDASIKQTGSMIPTIVIVLVLLVIFNLDKVGSILKIMFHIP
jgi:hypothetical protein